MLNGPVLAKGRWPCRPECATPERRRRGGAPPPAPVPRPGLAPAHAQPPARASAVPPAPHDGPAASAALTAVATPRPALLAPFVSPFRGTAFEEGRGAVLALGPGQEARLSVCAKCASGSPSPPPPRPPLRHCPLSSPWPSRVQTPLGADLVTHLLPINSFFFPVSSSYLPSHTPLSCDPPSPVARTPALGCQN